MTSLQELNMSGNTKEVFELDEGEDVILKHAGGDETEVKVLSPYGQGEYENAVIFDAKNYAGDNMIVKKGKTPTLEGFIGVSRGYVMEVEKP